MVWPALILVLALLLRLLRLEAAEPWLDEACSLSYARLDLASLFHSLRTVEDHPPLYYLVLKACISIFGEDDISMRLPSLFAGLATVAIVFAIGKRFLSPRTGLLAALVVAFSPLCIHYSVEARPYMLLTALGAFSLFFALAYAEKGGFRTLVGLVVCTTLALYTHYFALFLVPPLLGTVLLQSDPKGRTRKFLLFLAPVSVLCVPMFLAFALPHIRSGIRPVSWMWEISPPSAIFQSLKAFMFGVNYPWYLGLLGASSEVPKTLEYVSILFFSGMLLFSLRHITRRVVVLLFFLFFPIVLPALLSLIRPLYLPGRLDLQAAPAFWLLVAYGLDKVWSLKRKYLAKFGLPVIALVLVFVSLAPYLLVQDIRPNTRLAIRIMEIARESPVSVVFTHLTRPALELQLRRLGFKGTLYSFPSWMAEHPCWIDSKIEARAPERLSQDALSMAQALRQTLGHNATLVVVVTLDDKRKQVADWPINTHIFSALEQVGFRETDRRRSASLGLIVFRLSS